VARVGVPIAFTRIDRWLTGLIVLGAVAAVSLVGLSQAIVAPPRPRISESARPTIGLALREDAGVVRIVRAAGPSAEAGLKAGDRIAGIEGKSSPSLADVLQRVAAATAGKSLSVEARRGPAGPAETAVMAEVQVVVRDVSPEDFGLPFEDITFRNPDGLVLRGWYLPPPPDGSGRAPAVAFGHGETGDRRDWLGTALAVHDAGFAGVLFDFTGRGESDGDVISLGVHEANDLRSALDTLAARPEVDPFRLAVAGRGMGAVAAIFLAADDARVKAVVLDSPYADLASLIDRIIGGYHLPSSLFRPVVSDVAGWRAHYKPATVRPLDGMRKIKAPILLFHGDADTRVPFDDAKALKAAATAPITLVPLTGADHDTPRPTSYQDRVATFLTKSLPAPWRNP